MRGLGLSKTCSTNQFLERKKGSHDVLCDDQSGALRLMKTPCIVLPLAALAGALVMAAIASPDKSTTPDGGVGKARAIANTRELLKGVAEAETSSGSEAAKRFVWLASHGTNAWVPGTTKTADNEEAIFLLFADNPTNWYLASTNPVYREPDYYTNYYGPIARDAGACYHDGQYLLVYNFDPFDTNVLAQGLGIARSTDLTNWSRIAVIYPMGTTNANATMFAASWFEDTDGSLYLVFAYSTEGVVSPHSIYQIRALDNTYTNWSVPVLLKSQFGPHGAQWDGFLVRKDSTYHLFYIDTDLYQCEATNSTLTSEFTFERHPWGDISYEGLGVFQVSSNYWIAFGNDPVGPMHYSESTDDMSTWSAWTLMPVPHDVWFSWGMIFNAPTGADEAEEDKEKGQGRGNHYGHTPHHGRPPGQPPPGPRGR